MSISASHVVPAPRDQVWEWHTRQGSLTRLSAPFFPMTPITQATSLADGTTVLALPAGLKWVARHDLSNYRRGYRFTDVCVSAPLKLLANWRHVHEFTDHPDGTMVTDLVSTRVPASALKSMFAYRQHQLVNDLAFLDRINHLQPAKPLVVAITGASGLVGRELSAQLSTAGHNVIHLVRKNPKEHQRLWDPEYPSSDLLDGVDILIHLAGEPIFGRFSDNHKQAIRDSRVGPTRRLAQLVADSPSVTTMISASAVGYYGSDRGEEPLTESSERGDGLLADIVADWEEATEPAMEAGKRVIRLRTGSVISGRSGILPVLKALFSTGLGGSFGDGKFWFSWISLDDLTDIILTAVLDASLSGAINAVSPNPVLNRELTTALGSQLHRPAVIPIPNFGPTMLLGREGARNLALADQRVLPTLLNDAAHHFRYPLIDTALAHELGGEDLADPDVVPSPVVDN